jgi:hypothetical protein
MYLGGGSYCTWQPRGPTCPWAKAKACSARSIGRASHVGVGNAVVVAIEAHIGGIAGAHRPTLLGGKGVIGQRQQSWLLLREGLAHRD